MAAFTGASTAPALEFEGEMTGTVETVSTLTSEVQDIVQDDNYATDAIVLDALNVGLLTIAGTWVDGQGRYHNILLPDLETVTEIPTKAGVAYTGLPSDFMKHLHRCYSTTYNRQVHIYGSSALLLRRFEGGVIDSAGPVFGAAVRGRNLHYQRVPSSPETLRLYYYRYPDVLVATSQRPTCLPEHLINRLLVNYACMRLFSRIEDGVEGQKVNTEYHRSLFSEAMGELVVLLGPEARAPVEVVDELSLDVLFG